MLCLSHMAKVYFSCALFSILLFFTVPSITSAQGINPLAQTNPSALTLSPRYSEPDEQVTATLNDYSVNTNGATIQWFYNGQEIPGSKNERTIQFPSGKLGESSEILALTKLPNGTILRANSTITPVRVDMLIEANTRVPSFYKGRAIPSEGGSIQVTAIPFTGVSRSAESFSYTWRVGEEVKGGGSRFGKNSINFTAGFQKEILVSVDVIDTDGSLVTSESVYVPLSEPELNFYEVNPLRGMSEIAIGSNFIFVGEEIKVRAEPYFIDNTLFTQSPHQEWKLNGQTITNPNDNQQELTLRRSGDTGSFTLEFHVRNLKQLLQGVKDSVTIKF